MMNGEQPKNAVAATTDADADAHRTLGTAMAEMLYTTMQRKGFLRILSERMEFDKVNHTTPLYDPAFDIPYRRIARHLNRRIPWHACQYNAGDVARILYKLQQA